MLLVGAFNSLSRSRYRFDSGSFIELTVITSPRMDARSEDWKY